MTPMLIGGEGEAEGGIAVYLSKYGSLQFISGKKVKNSRVSSLNYRQNQKSDGGKGQIIPVHTS